jgi:hypothetical protein
VERQSDVVGSLTTHGDDNSAGALHGVDVEHVLQTDVLEVKAVRFVVIGGNGLRVVTS